MGRPPRGSRQNNDLTAKRKRAVTNHKKNNGDFEKMFGKDIDKYLEESEWDMESMGGRSHASRASHMNSQNEVRLKKMERTYLQESQHRSQVDRKSAHGMARTQGGSSVTRATKAAGGTRKPPAFREFQDRFTDDANFIHKGEITEFETLKQTSSQKKAKVTNKAGSAGAGFLN